MTAVEQLVPHRPPMLWLDELTDCTDTTARATTRFSAEHFAVEDGKVLETALVECMAQTAAAALGQRARAAGNPGATANGMLAAMSKFQVHSAAPLDTTLVIEIKDVKRLGPMLLIEGRISADGRLVASGELSLYA